jgi:glycosyltransferase involved in cell wall biosynthesis
VLIVEQGGRGGVADYTSCLAKALAERGLPVTVATADDHLLGSIPGVRIAPIFRYVRGHSAPARVARDLRLGPILNGLRFLGSMPRLARLARQVGIVHIHGWEANSLGIVATAVLLACHRPIVYTAHNTFERRPWALDATRIFPVAARETIVHTSADQERIRRRVTVIPHGHYGGVAEQARPVTPAAARETLGLAPDALIVLLFGVLRPDKGLGDLLHAAAEVPEWLVLVAGQEDGALHTEAPLLARADLAGRVTIREGFHEIDAVAEFFAAADLVAVPYRQASQSGVLHLAYGFTRPVVAYPVGGLIEAVVDGETGWMCAEPTPEALAAALRDAASGGREELRRRGEAAKRWAMEAYSWSTIADATEAVYAAAIQASPRRAMIPRR